MVDVVMLAVVVAILVLGFVVVVAAADWLMRLVDRRRAARKARWDRSWDSIVRSQIVSGR